MRQASFTVILALLAHLRVAVAIPFADSVAPSLLARVQTLDLQQGMTKPNANMTEHIQNCGPMMMFGWL